MVHSLHTQCYILKECGDSAHCTGCVSGPTHPDIDSCPWPPNPTDYPTTPTTPRPTTKSTTKITTERTTTTTKRTSTSKKPTTTSNSQEDCKDIHINDQCDWDYGLISLYKNVMTGSECQYVCRDVQHAKYFSHYNKGHEAEHGICGCFSSCSWPSSSHCHDRCSTHEVFSEEDIEEIIDDVKELDSAELFGGEVGIESQLNLSPSGRRWCHCMRGTLNPDVDTCDLWP